ncbi:MAG: LemA family protein [Clostridia bacterium]|nr:LemA family protein [Clostridia bacterium]
MELWIIPVIIVAVFILIFIIMYNNLLSKRNKVKRSVSGVGVYLKQRFDLIPNLVEICNKYSNYEKEILEKIVKLRSEYVPEEDKDFEKANEINSEMNKIIGIAEEYPELKASEQYLNLQKSLEKIESQIQAARRAYNIDVTEYNTSIESVPTNIIAKLFKFEKANLFEATSEERENIKIK